MNKGLTEEEKKLFNRENEYEPPENLREYIDNKIEEKVPNQITNYIFIVIIVVVIFYLLDKIF